MLLEKKISKIIMVVVIGMLVGSLMGEIIGLMPNNVVKKFFTTSIYPGIGFGEKVLLDSQGNPVLKDGQPVMVAKDPFYINLIVVKFKIGIQFKLNVISILGIFLSKYMFAWYK